MGDILRWRPTLLGSPPPISNSSHRRPRQHVTSHRPGPVYGQLLPRWSISSRRPRRMAKTPGQPGSPTMVLSDIQRASSIFTMDEPRLNEDFLHMQDAGLRFPPEISEATRIDPVKQYLKSMVRKLDIKACASCDLGGHWSQSLEKEDQRLKDFWEKHCDNGDRNNYLSWLDIKPSTEREIVVCDECYRSICNENIPRFSSLNNVNIFHRQAHPEELLELTRPEEALIALHYPLATVFRLKQWLNSSYDGVRGHILCIPQDPRPLLIILPDPKLVYEHIQVIWCGKDTPTERDLHRYMRVRRSHVEKALKWLVENNDLYKRLYEGGALTLDNSALMALPQDGVPQEILNGAEHDPDITASRAGIAENLEELGADNDMQAAQIRANGIASTGCVYSDTQATRIVPELVQLNTLHSQLTSSRDAPSATTARTGRKRKRDGRPIETRDTGGSNTDEQYYILNGAKAISLVNLQDEQSFVAAFPTIYPYGQGGPYQKRKVRVSLKSYVEWTLKRVDTRFAQHPLYLYLAFDRIVLSEAAVANSIRIKHTRSDEICKRLRNITIPMLEEASRKCERGEQITEPNISLLLGEIRAIGQHVTCSYGEKTKCRAEIRGLILEYGLPLFWLTITPSDLQNPLVIKYTNPRDFESFMSSLRSDDSTVDQAGRATVNPVGVAKFFTDTCNALFSDLIAAHPDDKVGVLGPMRAHYGVVESNGRGMLHVHCFIWASGSYKLTDAWDTLQDDRHPDTQGRMVSYLESVIREHIRPTNDARLESVFRTNLADIDRINSISPNDVESWAAEVADKFQRHLKTHTPSCRKGGTECRYSFPRELVPRTVIKDGVLKFQRDDPWVNNYNPSLAAVLMANQDIQAIGSTATRALAAMYYMCCYATKDDAKPKDIVAQAIFLKKSIEQTSNLSTITQEGETQGSLDAGKFAMKCHNRIAYTREQSGPMVAYRLLGGSVSITSHSRYETLHLNSIHKQFVRVVPRSTDTATDHMEEQDNIDDVVIEFRNSPTIRATAVDRYLHRGPSFQNLCLYDYIKHVRHEKTKADCSIPYESPPPHLVQFYQRLCDSHDEHKVRLFGTLKVKIGDSRNSDTFISARDDDEYLAALKLCLFIPWGQGCNNFQGLGSSYKDWWDYISADHSLDTNLRPRHVQYAKNLHHLLRSASDADRDQVERRSRESLDTQQRETRRQEVSSDPSDMVKVCSYLLLQGPQSSSIVAPVREVDSSTLSIMRFVEPDLMKEWKKQLRTAGSIQRVGDHPTASNNISTPSLVSYDQVPDDLKARILRDDGGTLLLKEVTTRISLNRKQTLVFNIVMSHLLFPEKHLQQLRMYVGGVGGTGKSRILQAIRCALELLQRTEIMKYMAPTGMAADVIHGSTWHSALGVQPLSKSEGDRSEEPSNRPGPRKLASARLVKIRNDWDKVMLAVVDEVSMVSTQDLEQINEKLQMLRPSHRHPGSSFGAIEVVLVMGDFCQFAPVIGDTLWRSASRIRNSKPGGRQLWDLFHRVIILDEQMRQNGDPIFQLLLQRARDGEMTSSDVQLLNTRTTEKTCVARLPTSDDIQGSRSILDSRPSLALDEAIERSDNIEDSLNIDEILAMGADCTPAETPDTMRTLASHTLTGDPIDCYVVQTHRLKSQINWARLRQLATATGQKISIFLSRQTSNDANSPSWLDMAKVDGEGSGCLAYLPIALGMRAMHTINADAPNGLVNGTMGTVTGVVTSHKGYDIGDDIVVFPQPPDFVIFKPDKGAVLHFAGLNEGEWPIAPRSTSIQCNKKTSIKSLNRLQTTLVPGWAITDYKCQGQTYNNVVVDIRKGNAFTSAKQYTSVYVQLSRCRSLSGLHLFAPITLCDVGNKPPGELRLEFERLLKLESQTIQWWTSFRQGETTRADPH